MPQYKCLDCSHTWEAWQNGRPCPGTISDEKQFTYCGADVTRVMRLRPALDDEHARVLWWRDQLLINYIMPSQDAKEIALAASQALALRDAEVANLRREITKLKNDPPKKRFVL